MAEGERWRNPFGQLLSRLQNLFVLTVWPSTSSKKISFSEDDDDVLLFGNMPKSAAAGAGKKAKFLDRYSEADIFGLFESFRFKDGPHSGKNLSEVLSGLGFHDLLIDIDASDSFVHRVQLYFAERDNEHLLGQLFVRRETAFSPLHTKLFDATRSGVPDVYAEGFGRGLSYLRQYFAARSEPLQVIVIEWLRFQNPTLDWGSKSPLPGQIHPGLGIVYEMHQLLFELCTLRHRDGVMDIPEHWYNAYLYAKMPKPYRFLNPAFEGFFQSTRIALEDDIKERGLAAVAWAILKGQLKYRHSAAVYGTEAAHEKKLAGEWIKWVAQEQVQAITPQLEEYFESVGYKELVAQFTHPEHFFIDWSSAFHPTLGTRSLSSGNLGASPDPHRSGRDRKRSEMGMGVNVALTPPDGALESPSTEEGEAVAATSAARVSASSDSGLLQEYDEPRR